ncbi:concanavalin A-like lectin/glucanase [Ramicandelaber brevisporus]|nr:concanavalin A-like lectin/glucanase [Ramicandelaber brevisporus]
MRFSVVGVVALSSLCSLVAAGCGAKSDGAKCDKFSPCCAEGYCDSKPSFCMASRCDPKYSYASDSCWPVPHCVDRTLMFKDAKLTTADKWDGNPNSMDAVSEFTPSQARITDDGLVMDLLPSTTAGKKQGFGATVSMTRWFEYGKVSVRMKSGTSAWGVVSSFIIKNIQGDEFDYEWVGKQPNAVQTNYFYDGILDYTKGKPSYQLAPTQDNFHEYSFDWNPDRFIWIINGREDRRLNRVDTWDANAKIFKYPSREALLQFSIWDGGEENPGTAQWAGTPTDWTKAGGKFTATVQSINIECFYKGNETTWKQPKPTNNNGNNGNNGNNNNGGNGGNGGNGNGNGGGNGKGNGGGNGGSGGNKGGNGDDDVNRPDRTTGGDDNAAFSAQAPSSLAVILGLGLGALFAAH